MPNILPFDFNLTLMIFYWLYFAALLVYFILAAVIMYHLLRYGFFTAVNISAILLFLALSIGLVIFTFAMFGNFNWKTPLFNADTFNHSVTNLIE